MNLRKNPAKKVYYSDSEFIYDAENSNTSHFQASLEKTPASSQPSQPPQRKKAPKRKNYRKKEDFRLENVDVLTFVLEDLDIRQTFDVETLKELRLTCREFREIVDAEAFKHFSFSTRNHEAFNQYLKSPKLIQHVESVSLDIPLTIAQATYFVIRPPPKLKALELSTPSDAFQPIFCGNFPKLTSLTLKQWKHNNPCWTPMYECAFWPLKQLCLQNSEPTAVNLLEILEWIPDLRTLQLENIIYDRQGVPYPIVVDAVHHLEVLEISGTESDDNQLLQLPLFFDKMVKLPTLHTFQYQYDGPDTYWFLQAQIDCSFMKQLRSLHFGKAVGVSGQAFQALVSALNGGPLESLTLSNTFLKLDWKHVSLPHLKKLDVHYITKNKANQIPSDNFFDWFSSAQLPMLEEARIEGGFMNNEENSSSILQIPSSSGIDAFKKAFPRLRSLSFKGLEFWHFVLQDIFVQILPQLEEFSLEWPRDYPETADFSNIFKITGGNTDDVCWTKLQKFVFKTEVDFLSLDPVEFYGPGDPWDVREQLLKAARHSPMLSHLCVEAVGTFNFFAPDLEKGHIYEVSGHV